jgi:hypothetical protein
MPVPSVLTPRVFSETSLLTSKQQTHHATHADGVKRSQLSRIRPDKIDSPIVEESVLERIKNRSTFQDIGSSILFLTRGIFCKPSPALDQCNKKLEKIRKKHPKGSSEFIARSREVVTKAIPDLTGVERKGIEAFASTMLFHYRT